VPVLHGDTLYAFTEVVATDSAPAGPRGHREVGLVHFRHWGVNQRGETVFEGERLALIKKRSFNLDGLGTTEAEAPVPVTRRRPAATAQRRAVRRTVRAMAKAVKARPPKKAAAVKAKIKAKSVKAKSKVKPQGRKRRT